MARCPVAFAMSSASSSRALAPSRSPSRQRTCARWIEREREHPEGAVLARQLNAARGEVVPGVVGEQLRRDASGEPGPADTHVLPLALLAKRGECPFQRGRAGGVAVGEPNRQPVDEQVHGARLIRYAAVPREPRVRPPASRGRACRRRLRPGGRPGTRRAKGKRQAVRAAWPRRGAAAARLGVRLRSTISPCRSFSLARSSGSSGPAAGPREQPQRFLGGAGQVLAGGGFQRAVGPAGRVGRERRRSLEERSGRRESASRAGALGGLLQLEGDVLVGLRDRVRAMPGAAIRVELGVGGCRQRPMRGVPLVRRRRAVDRRAQKRVAKRDLRSELQQAVGFRRRQLVHRDADLLRGAKEQRRLTRRIGCGHEQQPLRRGRQLLARAAGSSLRSGLATIRRPAARIRPRAPWRELAWQLEQRERIAARLREYPLAHALVERSGDDRREQRSRGARPAARRAATRAARSAPRPWPARARRTGRTTESAAKRRATNASTCAEDRSSHWTSSTRQTSGRSAAAWDSKLSTARLTRNRSGCAPELKPNAISSASRCGAGSPSRPSSSPTHSWCSPANGSSISHSAPTARHTRQPSARSAA